MTARYELLPNRREMTVKVSGADSGWQPIETAPAQRIVLVHYLNSHGKSRIIRARYVPMMTEELHFDFDELDGDYCETTDTFYVPAGWYEQIDNGGDFSEWEVTEGQPDAWMPLPAPPEQAQRALAETELKL